MRKEVVFILLMMMSAGSLKAQWSVTPEAGITGSNDMRSFDWGLSGSCRDRSKELGSQLRIRPLVSKRRLVGQRKPQVSYHKFIRRI
jgi:hypothetical protein